MVYKYLYNEDDGTIIQTHLRNESSGNPYFNKPNAMGLTPSINDRIKLIEFLLEFNAIKAPDTGELLDDIIPRFRTYYELERWQSKMIKSSLESSLF